MTLMTETRQPPRRTHQETQAWFRGKEQQDPFVARHRLGITAGYCPPATGRRPNNECKSCGELGHNKWECPQAFYKQFVYCMPGLMSMASTWTAPGIRIRLISCVPLSLFGRIS